jgi:hypothetical protein
MNKNYDDGIVKVNEQDLADVSGGDGSISGGGGYCPFCHDSHDLKLKSYIAKGHIPIYFCRFNQAGFYMKNGVYYNESTDKPIQRV